MNNRSGLVPWKDVWSPLSEFRSEFDRLFDDWMIPNKGRNLDNQFAPACDVEEIDDHYLLSLEMPGIKKDDIKLEMRDNQMIISGERRQEEQKKEKGYSYSERRFGKFQRSFTLPSGIDGDKIEANYQDGVLRVVVPKAESVKPKQIKITNGGGSKFFGKLLGSKDKEEVHSSSEQSRDKAS